MGIPPGPRRGVPARPMHGGARELASGPKGLGAAITGHSIHRTQWILETYLPRDTHMARAAIIKLERHK